MFCLLAITNVTYIIRLERRDIFDISGLPRGLRKIPRLSFNGQQDVDVSRSNSHAKGGKFKVHALPIDGLRGATTIH